MTIFWIQEFNKIFYNWLPEWYNELSLEEKNNLYREALEDYFRLSKARDEEFMRMLGNLTEMHDFVNLD